jgi:hypothetical protein
VGTSLIITPIADLAARQDGVVSLDALHAHGLNDRQVRTRVDRGWIEKVAPRVYRVAGAPDTHRQRLRIGLLTLGGRSWVSYESAATMHGLDRSDEDALDFTIERGRRVQRAGIRIHTTQMLDPIDTVMVNGFRTLSATRTIIDLAHMRCSRRRVEAALDSAVRLGLSHPEVLERRLQSLRGSGRWGCRLIDRLLPDSGGHSPIERSFLSIVSSLGFERPETQVVHRNASGQHVARVDFLFRDANTVVEVTGRLGHVSDAERERDAQRRNELQHLGMRVIEYTSTQIRDRRSWVGRDLCIRLS